MELQDVRPGDKFYWRCPGTRVEVIKELDPASSEYSRLRKSFRRETGRYPEGWPEFALPVYKVKLTGSERDKSVTTDKYGRYRRTTVMSLGEMEFHDFFGDEEESLRTYDARVRRFEKSYAEQDRRFPKIWLECPVCGKQTLMWREGVRGCPPDMCNECRERIYDKEHEFEFPEL